MDGTGGASSVFLRAYSDATSCALVFPCSLTYSDTREQQVSVITSASVQVLTRIWDGDSGSVASECCRHVFWTSSAVG